MATTGVDPATHRLTRTRRFGAAILILLAMVILTAAGVSLALRHPLQNHTPAGDNGGRIPGFLENAPKDPPASAEQVTVGLYALDAYDIDPAANTFYMTGYLWMKWSGDIDPTDSLEFVNAVDDWGLTTSFVGSEPKVLPSGEKLRDLRFQGRFYEPFNMSHYPLDSQRLDILIESNEFPISQLALVPDQAGSNLDAEFTMPGWDVLNKVDTRSVVHSFGTDFGDTTTSTSDDFSGALFSITIQRAPSMMVWKVLLPLLLVLVTAWLALIVSPKFPEIRIGMPATALLTAVFLQETAQVPWSSNPVTLDRIYVVAFASIVVTLAMVIWDELHIRGAEHDEVAVLAVEKHDLYAFTVNVVVTIGVIGLLIYSAATSTLLL